MTHLVAFHEGFGYYVVGMSVLEIVCMVQLENGGAM